MKTIRLTLFQSFFLVFLLMSLSFLSNSVAKADEATNADTASEAATTEPRSVQVPLFEEGKFKGYTEVPMDADRKPESLRQGDELSLDKTPEATETSLPQD